MRAAIPKYTVLTGPLFKLFEDVHRKADKISKRAVAKIALESMGWQTEHGKAFEDTKAALANAVRLAYPDEEQALRLFTDAGDIRCSVVKSKIPKDDMHLPFEQQRHQSLAFLSGSFKGPSLHWSTSEKKAIAIIHSVKFTL